MAAIVAIVGRPNVGKSTLFNRIIKKKQAIVDDSPGVTRDRNFGRAKWDDREFLVIDTGGFSEKDPDEFVDQIHFQVRQAIMEADVILMMADGKEGFSPYDRDMLALLRPVDKPVFFCINKIDSPEQEHFVSDFAGKGMDPVFPISAEHGFGMVSLLNALIESLPEKAPPKQAGMIKIAVVGRPNVGKSSLINKIAGSERLLVSDTPGTTRDSVDLVVKVDKTPYLLVDTAGIRRKGKVSLKLEKFSVVKALKSLEKCDVALILKNAEEGITDQDVRIAGYAQERRCGVIFLLNKWDLVIKEKNAAKKAEEAVRDKAKFLPYAPFLTISALTGQRVPKIFKIIDTVYDQYQTRVATGPLNRILETAIQNHEPSLVRGRRLKFYYITQASTCPPTFVAFVNYPDDVHFSYKRYLINHIRKETGLDKTPIFLKFNQRDRRP